MARATVGLGPLRQGGGGGHTPLPCQPCARCALLRHRAQRGRGAAGGRHCRAATCAYATPAPRSRGQQQPRKPCWPPGRGDRHAAASPARDTHRIARRRQHVACWRRSPRRRTLPSAPASHRICHVVRLAGSARKERHTAGRDAHPVSKTARTVREGPRYCQIHGSAYRCVRYGTRGVPAETAKLWCAARMWPYWYTAQSHQRASFPARQGACTGSRRHPSGEPRQSAIRPPGGSRSAVRPAQG